MKLTLGAVVCLGLLATLASASADGIELRSWFPDNPSMEFFPGKAAMAIIAVRNSGKSAVNLTAAVANLALVSAPEGNIFNFSSMGYQRTPLGPGEETNLEYGLFFPQNMPPREFYLNMNMILGSEEGYFTHQLFNQTINVIEESRIIDVELLGLYAMLLAALAAGVYGLLELAKRQGWVKKTKKTRASAPPTGASGDRSEWLKGTAADPAKKKVAAGKQN